MNIADIIRAWKDPAYRKSLSEEERAKLPENPVGQIELTVVELTEIMGIATGPNDQCHGNTQFTGCGQSTCSQCTTRAAGCHGFSTNPNSPNC